MASLKEDIYSYTFSHSLTNGCIVSTNESNLSINLLVPLQAQVPLSK